MTATSKTHAIYAMHVDGVQTLWVYREGHPVQAYPLPLPTIAGDNNMPNSAYHYFTEDMGDGRLGLYWYSTSGSTVHLNCLPVRPNGVTLDQWPVITVTLPAPVSTYTDYIAIVTKSFLISTDLNAVNQTPGHYYYSVYTKDLTHVRDGDLYVESGQALSVGTCGVAKDTVYVNIVTTEIPVGMKFDPTTGVPTPITVTPPTGGWYTTSNQYLTADQSLRSAWQQFVNSALPGGNQSKYVQGYDYAIFEGNPFYDTANGNQLTSSRNLNLLDENGNWCQFVIPYQGHGYSAYVGRFMTGEVVGDKVVCLYDETSGAMPTPGYTTTHMRISLPIPSGFTGFNAITSYTADDEWAEDTSTSPDYSVQDVAGYGGLTTEFWQLVQNDTSDHYNVKFWRSADNIIEDGGFQVDISGQPFDVTSYAMQVPTRNNAHHGTGVAMVAADGSASGLDLRFKGLGVPSADGTVTSPFFPVYSDRKTVSFEVQIGADEALWAQPMVDWGVVDGTQPDNTLIVGTEAVGPAYAFGGSSGWTQVDFTLAVPSDAAVWRPRLEITKADPSQPVPTRRVTADGVEFVADPTTTEPDSLVSGSPGPTLMDEDDSSYFQVWHDSAASGADVAKLHFTNPVGEGGASASEVLNRLRLKVDDDGTAPTPSEHRVLIQAYSSDSADPFFAVWHGCLPDNQIYDEHLTLDANRVVGTDHWWIFENHTTSTVTQDDPWPDITRLLASGKLVFDVIRENDARMGTDWTHGSVTVYEFYLTVPTVNPFPVVGTKVYLDCIYVPENGLSVSDQPYLDGDQSYGIWEGTPRQSTSLLVGDGYQPPPVFDPTVVVASGLVV